MLDPVHLVGTVLPRLARPFFPDILWRMPTQERILYLTFDDGPTLSFTSPLLEMLDQYGAKATFFVIGRYAERHPHLIQAIASAGHAIGNHTFSHKEAWTHTPSVITQDLEQGTGAIEAATGEPVRLMRPPWGQFTRSMRRWCRIRKQRLTMWDIGPGDFLPGATSEAIERRILRTVRPGSIIVLHDNPMSESVLYTSLPRLLRTLSDDGWSFHAL